MIYRRYRYRIYPTEVQVKQLAQHFGAVRFVYNWGLETKRKAWEESKEKVSRFELDRALTALKKEKKWLNEPSRSSLTASLIDLELAYKYFFTGKGFPKFKSKGSKQTVRYDGAAFVTSPIKFDIFIIKVPKIGSIKCAISQRFEGKFTSLTITKTPTGKYFASCLVALGMNPATKSVPVEAEAIGVDLGIKTFATLSNGEVIKNPRFLNKSLKALRRTHRRYSKKKKGSKNREKSRLKLARLHERVANQRLDFLHKTSTTLIRENQTVCIEDLNVEGMGKNHKLARHLKDVAFGTFRQLLQYKADWYGKNVLVIDRFAPSSKQCSCGHKNAELILKQRSWTCEACGMTHDRDLLAAQNIVKFAFHPDSINRAGYARIHACGDLSVSGSLKQEFLCGNTNSASS